MMPFGSTVNVSGSSSTRPPFRVRGDPGNVLMNPFSPVIKSDGLNPLRPS